jgi:NAD(P)-dependent dehydrogenase (short-subunit alcohol dehydrogenase family)
MGHRAFVHTGLSIVPEQPSQLRHPPAGGAAVDVQTYGPVGVLDGKAAIVTGGASGIGLATVRRFRAEGADVLIVDLDDAKGKAAADETGSTFHAADVSDADAWPAVVGQAEQAFGGVDLAFLNAGVTTGESDLTALTDAQYRRIMGANVDGVLFGMRAVVPAIERRGGGAVVCTASAAGLISFPLDPIYTRTKHAVVGLVRAVAPQLVGRRIRVNAICPGIVDTPLLGPVGPAMLEAAGIAVMPPEHVADAVLTAATGDRTGQAYVVLAGREPEPFAFGAIEGIPSPQL